MCVCICVCVCVCVCLCVGGGGGGGCQFLGVGYTFNGKALILCFYYLSDKSGWYQRSENNGWRLVSDRLIQHLMSDPVTWESSRKKVDFHHNKVCQ